MARRQSARSGAPESEPEVGLDASALEARRFALCGWYAATARDLPWRRTRDPYLIWVAETMLQQTQVATVIPYWERFIARFPDPTALAEAGDAELLALWSGLGYYTRAKNLRAAARIIAAEYHGRLPRRSDELLALPGIGRYTAGAILSIAFGESEPLVDGNVARVLARLFHLEAPLDKAPMQRRLWALARLLVPPAGAGPDGPGAFNQALMELGATLCVPGQPRCLLCPVQAFCAARQAGVEAELPHKTTRPAPIEVELELLLVRAGERLLLCQRAPVGRLPGMLDLPTRELGNAARLYGPQWPALGFEPGMRLGEMRHAITRHRILARVSAGSYWSPGGVLDPGGALRWVSTQELAAAPLSGLAKKAIARFDQSPRAL